jgi:hypothetical protein
MAQTKVGWRAYVATTTSSLLTSIYGVWNADTTSTVTTLNTNVYSAYNGENTLNDVVNSRNLTVGAGSVTYGTGKVGTNCFTLTSGQLNLPTNSMQFSGSFSYAFWVKYTGSVPQYNQIFTATGNTSKYGYFLYKYGTEFYLRFGDGSTLGANEPRVWFTVPNNITVNTWFHIVVVFNAGSSAQIYKDGQLIGSVNHTMASVLYDTSRPNPIFGNNPGPGTDGPMTGQLDAITFWDKGLTYAEVAALYNEGNGLQYSFPSSVTAYVPSPNDAVSTNHGTLMNGATFTTGKIGQAFTFDGVNDYVALPNNIMKFSNTDNWSISFWIYQTAGAYSGVIGNWDYIGGQGTGWGIRTSTAGSNPTAFTIQLFTNWSTGTGNLLNPLQTLGTTSINTWNHFVITRNSSAQEKIYQNGTLVASQTNSSTKLTYPATSYSCIGAERYQSGIVGYAKAGSKIDAMSVWNKELSATEITELNNSGNGKQYPNY